ncbi:substrate-binding periplasmic protein [Piscirickettsia salmonis]|uniref:substrate-binding periplasmic protein n=1 Tax=Piscirickettsia salmonis TaxID=1238 RepID=UPI0007C88278|nr:Bacterial extracellular solute-binding protein, family 3 [Piscirickettsiaceae bacterium NZ-RLO1]
MFKVKTALVTFIIFFNISSFAKLEKVTLTTGEWQPFVSQTLPENGIAAKIVTAAFAAVGIRVKYQWLPWKRAYNSALDGKADGSFPWSKATQREKNFLYSQPLVVSKTVFYHLKSKPFTWSHYSDLRGNTIGGSLGYSYGDAFAAAINKKHFKYQISKTDTLNLKKLLKGRIDIFPCSIEVCDTLIKQLGPEAKAKLTYYKEKPLETTSYYLIVSKKLGNHTKIINKFNKGLKLIGR